MIASEMTRPRFKVSRKSTSWGRLGHSPSHPGSCRSKGPGLRISILSKEKHSIAV